MVVGDEHLLILADDAALHAPDADTADELVIVDGRKPEAAAGRSRSPFGGSM